MLLELVAIGQLVTFTPEGIERYCVTRYVIDEPAIEFADHEGTWRRSAGDWLLIRGADPCRNGASGAASEAPAEETPL